MNEHENSSITSKVLSLKNRRRYAGIFAFVAVIVAVTVAGILRQHGVAMTHTETVLDCQYSGNGAHTHNDDCYDEDGNLVCPLEEKEFHVHDDDCYEEEDVLVCGLEEDEIHGHTVDCLSEDSKLVCGLEETEGHTHDDDCYDEDDELICDLEETEGHVHTVDCYDGELVCGKQETEGHEHTDDCFDEDGELVCGLEEGEIHGHTDDCFGADDELICGKIETEGHVHTDDCYEIERKLVCDKEEVTEEHVHGPGCFKTIQVRNDAEDKDGAKSEDKDETEDTTEGEPSNEDKVQAEIDTIKAEAENGLPAQSFSQSVYNKDGKEIMRVSVEAPEGAFPEGTTMEVSRVKSSDVEGVVSGTVADVGDKRGVDSLQAVDIVFRNADGDKIEPLCPITVSMSSNKIANKGTSPVLVHVNDKGKGEVVDQLSDEQVAERKLETSEDTIAFDADAFSVYVVAYLSVDYLSDSGDLYEVTVSYDDDAQIPEGSTLKVTEFSEDSEEYQAAWRAITGTEYLSSDENDVPSEEPQLVVSDGNTTIPAGMTALDISIYDESGEKVEPQAPVSVSILMKELPDADKDILSSTLEVHHLDESSGETVVETVASTDDSTDGSVSVESETIMAEFTVESFSTFGITWGTTSNANTTTNLLLRESNYTERVQLTVHYVDANGNAITRPSGIGTNTYATITWNNDSYTYNISNLARTISGYTYQGAHSGSYNGTEITSVTLTRTGTGRRYTYSQNPNTNAIYLVYSGSAAPRVTVHYGYINEGTFVEFDELPEGAQQSYGGPAMAGDQLNLRYEIAGKDYVTTRVNDAINGTQISPLLQTEKSNYDYWKYRILDTTTVNGGINEWQSFGTNDKDLYVIYRDKPTKKSYEDGNVSLGDLGAPAANKAFENNGDGTYDIALSVTGTSNSAYYKTHANVVIVLDTSSSMSTQDTGVPNQTRLQAAQNAIYYLADELFALNTTDDPKTIEIAFVNFSHRVRNEQTMNTIYSGVKNGTGYNSFRSMIGNVNSNGGTNYDTAIEAANSILWDDADPTYVVFVTDGDTVSRGYLEYNEAGDSEPRDWDGGTYYNGFDSEANYYARARSSAALQVKKVLAKGNRFYSIGVFGTVQYLQEIGGNYLGSANETQKIKDAFSTIVSEIRSNLGYKDLVINDGITSLSSTGLANGDISSLRYYRSGGANADGSEKYDHTANDGYGVEWEDAPAAYLLEVKTEGGTTKYYKNGTAVALNALTDMSEDEFLAKYPVGTRTVIWDINLGSNMFVENGVTYRVVFTMWPSQAAYDLVADLNNGTKVYEAGKNNSITAAERAQVVEIAAPTSNAPGSYSLKTNTSATVDYTSIRLENGEPVGDPTTGTAVIQDPKGRMILRESILKIKKTFEDELAAGEDRDNEVTLHIQRRVNEDGTEFADFPVPQEGEDGATFTSADITLSDDNNWEYTVYIAPGLIQTGSGDEEYKVLETGYEFTVTEPELDYHYDLMQEYINPMVIGAGDVQYLGDSNGDLSLTAINRVKSGVDVMKVLVDKDGSEITTDQEFTITGKLLDPDGQPYTFDNAHWTRPDVSSKNGASADWLAHQDDSGAYHKFVPDPNGTFMFTQYPGKKYRREVYKGHFDSTGNITFTLKAGEFIRFVNVPQGCTFEFTEDESNLPDYYTWYSTETVARHRYDPNDPSIDPADWPFTAEGDIQPVVDGKKGYLSTAEGGVVGNKQYGVSFTNKLTSNQSIVIQKTDEDGNSLDGAKFELDELKGSWTKVTGLPGADDDEYITIGTTTLTGIVLPDTVYRLTEQSAPDGYVILTNEVYFSIINDKIYLTDENGNKLKDEEGKVITDNGHASVTNGPNGALSIAIRNTPGTPLPHTGGPGTQIYTIFGTILSLFAGAGLVAARR